MPDNRDITDRLEVVAGFGGTHLDGIWSEAAAEIRRLREERPQIDYVIDSHGITHRSFTLVYKTRAALSEKEEK